MIFTKPEPTWLGTGALPVLAGADGSDSITGTEVLALGGAEAESGSEEGVLTGADGDGEDDGEDDVLSARFPMVDRVVHNEDGGAG